MSAVKSVVLVHGAWHRAACWDKVVAGLAARGVPVRAVELPFEGIQVDAAVAREAIAAAGAGAVAVGHSYGGAVISAAARNLPSVGHLVYLCALMLAEDDDVAALIAEHPMGVLDRLRPSGDGRLIVDPAGAVDVFYADCAPADVASALAQLRPMGLPEAHAGVRPAWHDVASTYVVCTEDRAISPALQRRMAKHASHVVEWPTSHSPFLSQPQRIVDLLEALVRA